MALTHRPLAEALRRTSGDMLLELARDITKGAEVSRTRTKSIEVEFKGDALIARLMVKERRDSGLTFTGCYVQITRARSGNRFVLRPFVRTLSAGYLPEIADRISGINELHTIGNLLESRVKGLEFDE